jgi:HEAT repeat protein
MLSSPREKAGCIRRALHRGGRSDRAAPVPRPLAPVLCLLVASCASAPVVAPPPPEVRIQEKLAAILRLEDHRILRDPAPPAPPPAPPPRRGRTAPPVAAPPPPPDLTVYVADSDPRVRRRAALALGRVGLAGGVGPLTKTLADPDPDVRQMGAFALGLIGDRAAVEPLVAALQDASPIVQGRAAEALGLIGDPSAAAAVGALARTHASAALAVAPDELGYPLDPAIEAFRLALYALVRLKSFDGLAAAVLDAGGAPRLEWWPVAYALQRIEDPRARAALTALARSQASSTAAFAARGLGALEDPEAAGVLIPLLDAARDLRVRVSAVRALGQIGAKEAIEPLMGMLRDPELDPTLRLEVVTALGALRATDAVDPLLDLVSAPWPPLRAAALDAIAAADRETFVTILSGLDPDAHWSVRAALARVLPALAPQIAGPRLEGMLGDPDQRVIPAVLAGLVRVRGAAAAPVLLAHLTKPDFMVRAAAAEGLGALQPADGVPALQQAYERGLADPGYRARTAALDALATYRTPEAIATIRTALADRDWAVRVRAAMLLGDLDPAADVAEAIRPAPSRRSPEAYAAPQLIEPAVSPHVYIETEKGTIQIELAVIEAPLTVDNFITLARQGFFNGLLVHRVVANFVVQDGDPRGDGEGGPGYTIRDELNELPYLRGTVGMALDWRDTGSSQFFITHSPQPHLDARYTVFGRVVSGLEVVDRLQQWDTIRRVRIWDGVAMTAR